MPISHSDASNDAASIRLLGVCTILLFLLAAVFWVLYPNKEKGDFSALQWMEYPTYTPDPVNGTIEFGIVLSSSELSEQSYTIDVELNRKGVGTKTIQLVPGAAKEIEYAIPVKSESSRNVEVRVKVVKQSAADATPLELFAWVAILESSP